MVKGLGVVTIDLLKKERDFKHLTLSDRNVVKYLIQFRSKVDILYGAEINIDMYQAGDIFEFNQELICLYSSLDKLLEKCSLNKKEKLFLKLLFDGYTIQDVVKIHNLYPSKSAYRTLNKIIDKIVKQNYKDCKTTIIKNILEDDENDEKS